MPFPMFWKFISAFALFPCFFSAAVWAAEFNPEVTALVNSYSDAARKADPKFQGFNAADGKEFFFKERTNPRGIKDACTTCHTTNLKGAGKTSAGKVIDPMAPSVNPNRLTDAKEIEKWFRRNCKQVLGRECSPQEKGDVLNFLKTQ
jgi:Domain of unknown function (DUF1924)